MPPSPDLQGNELIRELENWQDQINTLADELRPFKEGRTERTRAVAVAITKLDEARMWLAEAIFNEHH